MNANSMKFLCFYVLDVTVMLNLHKKLRFMFVKMINIKSLRWIK